GGFGPLALHDALPIYPDAVPAQAVLQALPQPILVLDEERRILFANYAAEAFFATSLSVLARQALDDLVAFGSPLVSLVGTAGRRSEEHTSELQSRENR